MNADPLIVETVDAILADQAKPAVRTSEADGRVPEALWAVLAESGFPWLGVPEEAGGPGGTSDDAAAMVLIAGRHAAPVPLADIALLGGWLLASAGLALPEELLTVAPGHHKDDLTAVREGGSWKLEGTLHRVPWGASAAHVVALVDGGDGLLVAVLGAADVQATPAQNLGREARDTLAVSAVLGEDRVAPAGPGVTREQLALRGALSRALLIAGALETVVSLTTIHAAARKQFGRPLNAFQAVAQNLAQLAEQAARANTAAQLGAAELATGTLGPDAMLAKIVAGEAGTEAVRLAHQIHGAIGVTEEYDLQLYSRRVWSWRDEYGTEDEWSIALGRRLVAAGRGAAWDAVVEAPGSTPLSGAPAQRAPA